MNNKHRFTVENPNKKNHHLKYSHPFPNKKNHRLKYSHPFCIASKFIVLLSSLYNSSLMTSRFSSPPVIGSLLKCDPLI